MGKVLLLPLFLQMKFCGIVDTDKSVLIVVGGV